MKRILKLGILVALSAAALASCKKEEEVTTSKLLTGAMKVDMPVYVHGGDKIHIEPSVVKLEDGSTKVGYYWSVPAFGIRDTTRRENDPASVKGSFDMVVPEDTLCNFTVTCVAFANGYYNSSASNTAAIVDTTLFGSGGSITGLLKLVGDYTIKDPRDERVYRCISVGPSDWMRQNLNYTGTGHPYYGYSELSAMFGRFYTWEEAQNACPDGWKLPSDEDWAAMAAIAGADSPVAGKDFKNIAGAVMADAYFNENKLWEFWPAVKLTDKTGLSMLPFGYGVKMDEDVFDYRNMYSYAFFWTSSEFDGKGVARYIYPQSSDILWGAYDKNSITAPIRCIKK